MNLSGQTQRGMFTLPSFFSIFASRFASSHTPKLATSLSTLRFITESLERRPCFTAACNALPRGRHQVFCSEFWTPQQSIPSVALSYAHGIPSAPHSLSSSSPSLSHDLIVWVQTDLPHSLQQDDIQLHRLSTRQTEHHWRLGATIDGYPSWAPPDSSMDDSDHFAWRYQVAQHLHIPQSHARPTNLSGGEHYEHLVRQGFETRSNGSPQTARQQNRRYSAPANTTSQQVHTPPIRQTLERADVIEEYMDIRQASRRAVRGGRGTRWPNFTYGHDPAGLR